VTANSVIGYGPKYFIYSNNINSISFLGWCALLRINRLIHGVFVLVEGAQNFDTVSLPEAGIKTCCGIADYRFGPIVSAGLFARLAG